MARGRLISRTLGSSRKFAALVHHSGKLAEFAQTLYPLLVACSDDFGRLSGDAFTVKHAVFPTSPRRESDFAAALTAMNHVGLIRWYAADGQQIIEIADFKEHQPGLHKRTESKFPGNSGKFPEIPSQEKGIEEKGIEENIPTLTRRATDPLPDGFSGFWEVYPKRKARAQAEKAWRKLAPDADLSERIVAAVAAQAQSFDWRKDGGQFVPYPATWLNARRWEDEASAEPVHRGPRNVASPEPTYRDWTTECQALHAGTCTKRWDHETRKQTEQVPA